MYRLGLGLGLGLGIGLVHPLKHIRVLRDERRRAAVRRARADGCPNFIGEAVAPEL